MPLMVSGANGTVLYDPNGSTAVMTFQALPAATAATTLDASQLTLASSSLTAAGVSVSSMTASSVMAGATATTTAGVNNTLLLEDQAAMQAGMDSTTPLNLFLGFAALLALVMLLAHPRFLARLFASIPQSKIPAKTGRARDNASGLDSPFGQNRVERVTAGGDLTQGWTLREAPKQTGLVLSASMDSPMYELDDPFASPLNEKMSPTSPAPPRLQPPPHISPLMSHIPFSSTLLFAPFSRLPIPFRTSANLAQYYIILCYLCLICLAMIWKSDITPTTKTKGYGNDFARTGLVACAQVPLVVLLGVRGNLIGLCVGKGYEKLKVFHKIVGRVLFLSATLHVAFFFRKWIIAGTFWTSMSKQFIILGLVAWVAIVVIALTSLPWVRKLWYGVFEICHFVGMIGLLVGLCFHVDVAVPFCIAALVVYLISMVASFTKTRLASAELVVLPGAQTTVVTVPALRTGWRAGQHVRIRVPALGLRHGLESHPFTIASAPNGDGLVLMCKAAGNWTQKLYDFASGGSGALNLMEEGKIRRVTDTTVILEGPYGGLGNTLLPSFSSVMLVAGGSGVTHALTLANDLLARVPTGVVRARTIDLVWVVRSEEAAKPFMPTLVDTINDAKKWEVQCLEGRKMGEDLPRPTALRVKLFITRCPASSPLNLLPAHAFGDSPLNSAGLKRQPSEADQEKYAYLSRNTSSSTVGSALSVKHRSALSTIAVHTHRPDFGALIVDLADETISRHSRDQTDASGVCVTACGPSGMVGGVRDGVMGVAGWRRRGCGGIELEEEQFGF